MSIVFSPAVSKLTCILEFSPLSSTLVTTPRPNVGCCTISPIEKFVTPLGAPLGAFLCE